MKEGVFFPVHGMRLEENETDFNDFGGVHRTAYGVGRGI